MDKVSILIPCYNVEQFLPECLDSIVNQTYPTIQICLYNDGSIDETSNICLGYSRDNNNIVYKSGGHKGVAYARNELIKMANGTYSLFVDADDWLEPDTVETLMRVLTENHLDIAMCHIVYDKPKHRYDSTGKIEIWSKEKAIREFIIHKEITGSLCNKFVKTKFLNNYLIPKNVNYGEDVWLTWKLLNDISKIGVIHSALYHYRTNIDSITHKIGLKERIKNLNVWQEIYEDIAGKRKHLISEVNARIGLESLYVLRKAGVINGLFKSELDGVRTNFKEKVRYIVWSGHAPWKDRVRAIGLSAIFSVGSLFRKFL